MLKQPILAWFVAFLGWIAFSRLIALLQVPVSWFIALAPLILLVSVAWLFWLMREAGRCFSFPFALWFGGGCSVIVVAGWFLLDRLPSESPFTPFLGALFVAALIGAVAGLGVALSAIVRYPNLLLPIALVVTVMDFWTVLGGGFVARVQERAEKGHRVAQQLVQAGTIKMPMPKVGKAPLAVPVVGIGDLFFAAFFFSLLWRFNLRTHLAFWLAVPLVWLALLFLSVVPIPLALPGLPFLALAVLLPNWRAMRYTPEEKRSLFLGSLFLLALLAVLTLLARQM